MAARLATKFCKTRLTSTVRRETINNRRHNGISGPSSVIRLLKSKTRIVEVRWPTTVRKESGSFSAVGVMSYPAARHSSAFSVLDSQQVILPLLNDEIRTSAGRLSDPQSALLSHHHAQGSANVRPSFSSRPVRAPQRARRRSLVCHAVVRHTYHAVAAWGVGISRVAVTANMHTICVCTGNVRT